MTSPKLDNLITEFVEEGDRTVASGHPKYKNGAVYINKNGDKFTGVPEEVWNGVVQNRVTLLEKITPFT